MTMTWKTMCISKQANFSFSHVHSIPMRSSVSGKGSNNSKGGVAAGVSEYYLSPVTVIMLLSVH